MLLAILLLAAGTVLVALGAESAVRGAARFALATGIPAFAIGALLFGIDFEGTAGALAVSLDGHRAVPVRRGVGAGSRRPGRHASRRRVPGSAVRRLRVHGPGRGTSRAGACRDGRGRGQGAPRGR